MQWPFRVRGKAGFIFMVCLATSTLFWFLQNLNQYHLASFNIPLDYAYVPPYWVKGNAKTNFIKVQVRAQGFQLVKKKLNHYWSNYAITLQKPLFSKDQKGKATAIWSNSQLKKQLEALFPEPFDLIAIEPSEIQLNLVRLVSKRLPLCPQILTPQSGFLLSRPIFMVPDSITATGPESELNGMNCWDFPLQLDGKPNQLHQKNISLNPKKNSRPDSSTVSVQWELSEFTELNIHIPVRLNHAPRDFQVQPSEVLVRVAVPMAHPHMAKAISASANFRERLTDIPFLPVDVKGPNCCLNILDWNPKKVELFIRENP